MRAIARLAIVAAAIAAIPGLALIASHPPTSSPETGPETRPADEPMTPLESWLLWIHIDATLLTEPAPGAPGPASELSGRRVRWRTASLVAASVALIVALSAYLVDRRQQAGAAARRNATPPDDGA